MSRVQKINQIAIVGPTASGKTALSLALAQFFDGEILCTDSRTIYQNLDIGTAKPTQEEQNTVPHWGLDLVEVGQPFTAADFQTYAQAALKKINDRGKLAVLVGGSGLLVESVLYDFSFRDQTNPEYFRHQLSRMTRDELISICCKNNYTLPRDSANRVRLIRTIESKGQASNKKLLASNKLLLGVKLGRDELRARIQLRIQQMLDAGLIDEVLQLKQQYGKELLDLKANIYNLAWQYIDGEISLERMVELATIKDMQLAKKQMTWWRRNQDVIWLNQTSVRSVLEKLQQPR